MKQWYKITAIAVVLLMLIVQLGPTSLAANDYITTTPTGYTKAEDVEYVIYSGTIQVTTSTSYTVSNVVVNWGARDEDCLFLTTYAQDYYTGSYSWDVIRELQGGSGTSDAYQSQLYDVLQDLMRSSHTDVQDYQRTRAYYCFTDCVSNDYRQISSFYSGKLTDGKWISSQYNREHIWPKSKCIYTDKTRDSGDIMMLRATITSENSARGNSAYGEGGGYYDPGISVRGDCARMVLYGYVRWGNTGKMWGSGGVMQNLDILLKWMEEDPVDTWEMGRNDAVQSITGVRNVFVDYPELAWLLFGQEVPDDMVTPSGSASEKPCTHQHTEIRDAQEPTCLGYGYSGDTYCVDCGQLLKKGQHGTQLGDHLYGQWQDSGSYFYRYCSLCGNADVMPYNCVHEKEELRNEKPATCTEDGYSGDRYCAVCGMQIATGEVISATGHRQTTVTDKKAASCTQDGYTGDSYCADCDALLAEGNAIAATGHQNTYLDAGKAPTCGEDGYSGDIRCADCGAVIETGTAISATGEHDFSEWDTGDNGTYRSCKTCGYTETKDTPSPAPTWPIIALIAAAIAVALCLLIILRRKKNNP